MAKLTGKLSGTLILLGCLASCANPTTQLQQGKHDYQYHHYKSSFNKLLPLAQQGNAEAQYAVGYDYYYGKGVLEDQEKGQYWINKAAQQGYPLAIRALEIEATQVKPKTTTP